MTPETIELIKQMSGTLSGTAAQIWASAILQARMQAWLYIGTILTFAVILGVAAVIIHHLSKKVVKGTESDKYPDYVLDDEPKVVSWLVWVMCAIIWGCYSIISVPEIVTMFANPTFWAISQIIGGGSN